MEMIQIKKSTLLIIFLLIISLASFKALAVNSDLASSESNSINFEKAVSNNDYLKAWKIGNEILKQGPINKSYLTLLDGYWSGSLPGFRDAEDQEALLLMIASYVVQGFSNRQINRDITSYLKFSEKAVNSKYPQNVSRAILILAYSGKNEYVPIFERNLHSADRIVSDGATIALALSCSVTASEWARYTNKIKNEKRKAYANEVWMQLQGMRRNCDG